jgi:LysM repeat protein
MVPPSRSVGSLGPLVLLLAGLEEGVRAVGTAHAAPPQTCSTADEAVLTALEQQRVDRALREASVAAVKELSADLTARQARVAAEWQDLSAKFGAPETTWTAPAAGGRAHGGVWGGGRLRASAQDVTLGGSVTHQACSRELSPTVRLEERPHRVDHAATIAAAEAWLARVPSEGGAASGAPPTVSAGGTPGPVGVPGAGTTPMPPPPAAPVGAAPPPTPAASVAPTAASAASVAPTAAPAASVAPTAASPAASPARVAPSKGAVRTVKYVVQRGDTLSAIADRHRVTVAELKAWNKLPSASLYVGQTLVIQTTE